MTTTAKSPKDALDKISEEFAFNTKDVKEFISLFHLEMARGLEGGQSSLKMIDSFARRPSGSELGTYLALDLGGTNFRVMAVNLRGKGEIHVGATSRYSIPKDIITGKGEDLFNFIASKLGAFIESGKLAKDKTYALGFTFSFPVKQTGIKSGTLIAWTKGFSAEGVVGKDVVALLEGAMKKQNINCISVEALANDTVGTMIAKCYARKDCDIGVILGTGTNACYPESRISGLTVNTEWGNFNKLRQTKFDLVLDDASNNPGLQLFEKAVSGMYLGEIFRLVALSLIDEKLLFASSKLARSAFEVPYSFTSEQMSSLAEGTFDAKSTSLSQMADEDFAVMVSMAKIISTRSARLAAAAVASLALWQDPKMLQKHVVAVDGSLYEKYPGYKQEMTRLIGEVLGGHAGNISFELTKDGSGTGAAVIAAVAASEHAT